MFMKHGMTIVDFEEIPIHSGSIRVTVRNRTTYESSKVDLRVDWESKWAHSFISDVNHLKESSKKIIANKILEII